MFGKYETRLDYQLPKEALEVVMREAADRYLALHQNVFPINREDSLIEFKVQQSFLSKGEIVVISIENESLRVVSKHCEASLQSLGGWLKNRHNVITLSTYVRDAVFELSQRVDLPHHLNRSIAQYSSLC